MILNPFRWWRARRRSRLLAVPVAAEVLAAIEHLPFVASLDPGERDELLRITRVLVAEKEWEGCGGLTLTRPMRVVIAAQAAMLVLHRPPSDRDYPKLDTILVYPHAFVNPLPQVDASGVVSVGRANHGEAWRGGPVVLDWDETRRGVADPGDGRNLVYHEFAHKLDMLDGVADGAPPLRGRAEARQWRAVMLQVFEALREAASHGRATLLDTYGATNPAEFFAVATEAFFERGPDLAARHPELYGVLRAYYGQDPAARS